MQHARDQRVLVNVQNKQIDLQQQAFKQIEKHNTSFATRHSEVISITPSTCTAASSSSFVPVYLCPMMMMPSAKPAFVKQPKSEQRDAKPHVDL